MTRELKPGLRNNPEEWNEEGGGRDVHVGGDMGCSLTISPDWSLSVATSVHPASISVSPS